MALIDNGAITDFYYNTTDLFKFKEKINQTGDKSIKNIEIKVPLKCLNDLWRTLKVLLINCEINLMLPWCADCVISSNVAANQATTFEITDTKLNLSVVTFNLNSR